LPVAAQTDLQVTPEPTEPEDRRILRPAAALDLVEAKSASGEIPRPNLLQGKR
jgi:hypothetical protein